MRYSLFQPRLFALTLSLAVILGLSACKKNEAPAAKAAAKPVDVTVMTVQGRDVPLTVDLVAEIKALHEVDLYAQVSGQIVERKFKPGDRVKKGQLLFSIDPRALDQAVLDAKAGLAQAEAGLVQARQNVERYRDLLPYQAVAQQTYEQAVAAEKQNAALVEAQQSLLAKARLDRSFAQVTAPIAGKVGLQQLDTGGLVTAGQTPLVKISTLDPVAVYFSITQTDYLQFFRDYRKSGEKALPIALMLGDGSRYAHTGDLDFVAPTINPETGSMTLRAIFPNPDELLRPGMFAQVRVIYSSAKNALLIPQKAVTELLARTFVSVLSADNKVEQRAVETGVRIGDLWLIESGLKAGERIVVDGVQKVRSGVVVNPITKTKSAASK